MTTSLPELARAIDPARTALFLGAGASVGSGGLAGAELAGKLALRLDGNPTASTDFVYVCSILELKHGRHAVIDALRSELSSLEPTGGMLGLPSHSWATLYTTNYDRLIELSYKRAGVPLVVMRSNYDFGPNETRSGLRLYKLHGCVTQDEVDGHAGRMLITERDYDTYANFREATFKQLEFDLLTKDFVFIGYSISDPHLQRDIDEASKIRRTQGLPGKIYVLSYTKDEDRALLYESRGLRVAFGGLDEFLFQLASDVRASRSEVVYTAEQFRPLSPKLEPTVVDAGHAATLSPNAVELFHGRPATYADIRQDLTFPRDPEAALQAAFLDETQRFVTVLGAAGVGKTTMARRIGSSLLGEGFYVWEHRPQFPFLAQDWIGVERRLREHATRGILILDDAARFQRQLNILAGALGDQTHSNLGLLVTSAIAEWNPRTKSPALYRFGRESRLSQLSDVELDQLLTLVDQKAEIHSLVDPAFSSRDYVDKFSTLRRRCSADMFVCLKNIFASDALDTIVLREFAQLRDELQDVYRLVAALEASGMQVHRQLVIRMTQLNATALSSILVQLEGIVDEFDIKASDGVFGWSTRHPVIAELISRYKFADPAARYELFKDVIDNLNPALWIEQRAIRDLCNRDFGVGALPASADRIDLLRRMIRLTPNERIPRHRLVATLLETGQLDEADAEIRRAIEAVGVDSPLNRYEVRVWLKRAQATEGILAEDRLAMILQAETLALQGMSRSPADKYSYAVYADVGVDKADLTGDATTLDNAIAKLRTAEAELLDPQITRWLSDFERKRARFN